MKPIRADRFMFERGLTRQIIGKVLDREPGSMEFERLEGGKPRLIESNLLHFNLSHCKDLFVLATSTEVELGVDVERTQRSNNLERIALHYFSDEEIDLLTSDPKQFEFRFTHLWTAKESIGKLIGTGISKTFLKNATKIEDTVVAPNLEWLQSEVSCSSYERTSHLLSIACKTDLNPTINIHDDGWRRI